MIVGQGPIALAVGAGRGCLDIVTLLYLFSSLSPSLWETARYRLKYCLKGPLNPKQPTNQLLLGNKVLETVIWVKTSCMECLYENSVRKMTFQSNWLSFQSKLQRSPTRHIPESPKKKTGQMNHFLGHVNHI